MSDRAPWRAGERPADRLTPARVAQIVDTVACRLGFDGTGAVRLKFTNNAVVTLPASRVVLRIPGSEVMRARVPAVIRAARWYAEQGIAAVRLWPDVPQPVRVGVHPVTIWREVAPGGPPLRPADLGTLLRAVHVAGGPVPDLPRWRVADGIRRRLALVGTADPDVLGYLAAELDDVEASLAGLGRIPPLVPSGVVHGDAHLGNVIASAQGPVLCDFDATGIGPREWDLTPAAVGSLRFRYAVDVHEGLVAAYGVDVTAWPGFPVLRRLRELQLVTSVLPALDVNPALRPQWRHRLETFRAADDDAVWTPYAEIGA